MRWKFAAGTALVSLSLAMTPVQPALAAPSQQNLDTLKQVYTLLTDVHYSHPDQDKLLNGAIQGMLKAVGDPFTNYMSPEQYQAFVGAIEQQYAGIGAAMQNGPDGVSISEVYAGTPAEKAGLQAGDVVVSIDGTPAGSDSAAAAARVRGAAGTAVDLVVRRGTASLTMHIIRAQIQLPTVVEHDLGDGIAYMQIFSFADTTSDEFEKALADIQAHQAKGLVIDLRGNGGGYVVSALQMADDLLSHGTILIAHDENGTAETFDADPAASQIPVAVLVDGNTASASEMLAGALQKNGRAVLIGQQTFGKGTMQEAMLLPNGGFLKVSIDRWELADGTSPDHVGLHPDTVIGVDDLAIHAAKEALLPGSDKELRLSLAGGAGQLNGIALAQTPAVLQQDGKVYLPLRYTLEALGHEVDWNGAERAVTFSYGDHGFRADVAAGTLMLDAGFTGLTRAVLMANGTTYLSVEALQTITGGTVTVADQTAVVRAR